MVFITVFTKQAYDTSVAQTLPKFLLWLQKVGYLLVYLNKKVYQFPLLGDHHRGSFIAGQKQVRDYIEKNGKR